MKIILSANTEWYLYNFRLNLARSLKASGWDVVFMSPPGDYVEKIEANGFRWIKWELARKSIAPWQELAAIHKAAQIYKAEKPDVVHHHTIKPGIYGSIAARIAGVKGIVNSITGRGYVFIRNDLRAKTIRGIVWWMYRQAFRASNVRVIFENNTDRGYFIENGMVNEQHAILIESVGVDEKVFKSRPEPEGVPVIMMAGRMLWDKGVQEVVDAARRLGAPEKVRVVLIGEPDDGNPNSIPLSCLQAWRDEGIVEWWGFRSRMEEVIAQCNIFTYPTKYAEGVPVALLEAAASGRPVVATYMPGPQDFVVDGETGYLVPPGDVEALSKALERLVIDAELRRKMGAAGRRRVEEKYTSGIVNQRTMTVYDRLLSK